jgi:gas vesicle protein
MSETKPNYNDEQYNHEFNTNRNQYENSFGQPSYLPANYDYQRKHTDDFYADDSSSNAGSFLFGALVGGVIGAAAALFLTPKSGSEMREDFSVQAGQIKDKSIEISVVAKDKATELTSVAKEKTGEISKTLQEQSGQIVEKVKSMKSKMPIPMDDGTVSSEGEEAVEFIEEKEAQLMNALDKGKEKVADTLDKGKEKVAETLDKSKEKVTETLDNSKKQVEKSADSAKNVVKEETNKNNTKTNSKSISNTKSN